MNSFLGPWQSRRLPIPSHVRVCLFGCGPIHDEPSELVGGWNSQWVQPLRPHQLRQCSQHKGSAEIEHSDKLADIGVAAQTCPRYTVKVENQKKHL